ncbi:hypothetical protein BSKO_06965 [Bryopsis sp. KO-2023]|nr:hypothetical protein BSKO_06965 [Bryopsis sp. KO-2023]
MNAGKFIGTGSRLGCPQLNRERLGGLSRDGRTVRVHAERAIFQMNPPRGPATLEDASDALDACNSHATADARRACFVAFGVDVGRVDAYYHTVQLYESSYKRGPGSSGNGILSFVKKFQERLNAATQSDQTSETSENKKYA